MRLDECASRGAPREALFYRAAPVSKCLPISPPSLENAARLHLIANHRLLGVPEVKWKLRGEDASTPHNLPKSRVHAQ